MDIAKYSSDARTVIKNAREVAATFRHPEIELEHLLIALVRHEGSQVESLLNQIGKSPAIVESIAEAYLKDQPHRATVPEKLGISPAVQEVLTWALEEKTRLYDALVEPEHIFLAMFDPKSRLAPRVRDEMGVTKEDLYRALADSKSVEEIASGAAPTATPQEGEAPTREVAGTLRYCIDLTNQAAAGEFDPLVGREKEVQQIIQILLRRRKNSPVLVGGAGVGKTAIVEGFAQAVVSGQVPKALEGVRVLSLDMGALVAGAKYKGEFEERFKTLIGEVVKAAGRIILFIDEIHTLAGAGNTGGGMDAANLLKPALARGQIRLIGATTEEEYIKYLEKDKALDRRFERVKVEEPTFDEGVRIIKGVLPKYEEHHKINYTEAAVIGAVRFAKRYLSERNLPDVALDLIDEAASEFAFKQEFSRSRLPELTRRVEELEELFRKCEAAAADDGALAELRAACETFTRDVARLQEMWGHRLEAAEAVTT